MVREMSAQEIESICRKRTRLEVSDTKALPLVLDSLGMEYRIVDNSKADVFGNVQVTQLVDALSKKGYIVMNIREMDESLESFYMNLVGASAGSNAVKSCKGGRNA